ncbi:MAG TPA: TIM-barrel domain-containing protein, partial [Pedobacter sp.]|nr:TIM-barrel domain-containing protein [Pedobacter sp.]
ISFTENQTQMVMSEDAVPMHWEENTEFGGYYVYATKKCQTEENFFGLGDKSGNMNLRGRKFQNWNTDAYSFGWDQDPLYRTIPFYIGVHQQSAYGIFFDNTFRSYFDFAKEDNTKTSFWADGGELQYYYIHGPHLMDVVKRYQTLTGTHPMPPKWALGYHQCRWSYYPEKKVKDIADGFRSRNIPCDAIYLDIDYMDGYRCFTWNKSHFPDPKRMIKELANDGFKTVVMIDPGIKVDDNYWVFKEGKENNFFCRRSDDYFMEGHVWPGRCQFPDFTNPAVREWWGGLYKELVEIGVAGVWNDMNEPAVFGSGTFPNDVRHNIDGYRGSHRKAHNVYGMQMVRSTYDGLKKLMRNKRPFTITRAGYSGMQRYGCVWTGDNVATWEHLKIGNIQCQRMSISGVPFCGTDIGGFSGEPDPELFTRWIQLGTFSPFMRAHSAGDTAEREPWSFGEPYTSINRTYIELRYRLLPYLYSVFWEHHRYGFPILRPLVMLEQENPSTSFRQDEFTFGDKILVCPVLEQGAASRMVYLPKGKWYNFWTLEVLTGESEHSILTPLDHMPLFVRAGSVIPEYPVMQYVGEKEVEEVLLNVYFADYEVNSFLFEDHGDTFAYEQDIYSEKKFSVKGTAASLVIEQSRTGLYTPNYEWYKYNVVGLPFKVSKVTVDDKEVTDFSLDAVNCLHFKSNKNFTTIKIYN